ncbi:hypothetical protein [Kaistella jeonii]|uniref:Uncharacterized protein n=1 Tax=Kaistella jeonii TaxID=266749 RepID=A0A0C1FC95_9FLAO|nr:hypothetical protein [Kaistella jeonii]KIA90657.1 hypothetical protein OA86_01905 [Kaistella jeonii]SFB69469.1 hypothetical protein SAMN05421876_101140 [Kaistella jeonii]VEI94740.1 Uncharacterised protein [Kaistella jeonii]
MKKISIILILLMTTSNIFAQEQIKKVNLNDYSQKKQEFATSVYQLFPTQNMWNFLKFNTRNGQIWQLQFSADSQNRFETILNSNSLVSSEKEINGRFTLYPTQNIWTFILLDQIEGNTWQVQWSTEHEKRFIVPLN